MSFLYRLLVFTFAFVAIVSCTNDYIYENDNPTQTPVDLIEEGTTELRFGVPITRATIDENLDLRWRRGDRIMVMAYDGATQIFSKEASFWANLTNNSSVGSQGYFKAKFDTEAEAEALAAVEDMADGKCYAISPVKGVTIDGTQATMTIPAKQTGEYSDAPDFMTASSGSISNLKLCTGGSVGSEYNPEENNYINDINLSFVHHTHAFRVRIPSNMLGKAIAKAYLKFPFAVVGDVTVDYTTGVVTEVKNTSDLVVVEFSQPKTAGDEFWVFINGVANKGQVDIRFQTVDGIYTERRLANFTQKNWVAGAVSKINISIPQATTFTTIQCSVPNYSQLGEPVTNLHLTLAEGFYFTDYTTSSSTTINQSGSYIADNLFVLFSDMVDDKFRSAKHLLTFESQNALVPNPDPIVFGSNMTVNQVNTYALTAPYLFEQNFDAATTVDSDAASAEMSGVLAGWTGSRFGVNKALMLHVYQGTSTSSIDNKNARIDSPTMAMLKPTAKVSLKLVCNYGGTTAKGTLSNAKIMQSVLQIGTSSMGGVIEYTEGLDSQFFSADAGSNGSYTNTPSTATVTLTDCTANHRLAWRATFRNHSGSSWSVITAKHVYVYVDNVKVSITK